MDKQKKNEDNDWLDYVRGIALALAVFLIWIYSWHYVDTNIISTDDSISNEAVRGVFGDKFGAVNSLFSGLAFAGIIFTIFLQKRELKLQREELQETRKEFNTQNETLKIQRFENTFFNLLDLHHQIVNAIDFTYYKSKENKLGISTALNEELEIVTIRGRDVFEYTFIRMRDELQRDISSYQKIYSSNYSKMQNDFGHYFRNLYRMVKLVDETDFFYDIHKVPQDEVFKLKYRYTSIIRSQLSNYELLWLFYNCISSYGSEKFKPLIEEYSILKNMPKFMIDDKSLIDLYKKKAFEPQKNV